MEYKIKKDGTKATVAVSGRIDTTTAPELEQVLDAEISDVLDLTIDFDELEYISSAGLRLLLMLQKNLSGKGSFKIVNVSDFVMEVFEMTGFKDIITIE